MERGSLILILFYESNIYHIYIYIYIYILYKYLINDWKSCLIIIEFQYIWWIVRSIIYDKKGKGGRKHLDS